MTRLKIKISLPAVLLLVGLIFLGFAGYAVSQLRAINISAADLASNWLPSVEASKDMTIALGNLRVSYRDDVLATSAEDITNAEAAIAEASARFLEAKAKYETHPIGDFGRGEVKKISDAFTQFQNAGKDFVIASRANNDVLATSLLDRDMRPLSLSIGEDLDALVQSNMKGADKSYADSQKEYAATLRTTFAVTGVAAIALCASICFVLFGIVRPLTTITRSMIRLATGDNSAEIPFAGRSDEIGEIAGAVEVFRLAAINNQRLEQEAEASRSQAEANLARLRAEAEAEAQARLREATSELASGLRRLAAGDLDFQLSAAFASDFDALRRDLNSAVGQLSDTLRAVAQAAMQIDTGTREISLSTVELSKRTEQQAASLEETAAALDQITVNVANSSNRAEEARNVAEQANSSAAHSGKIVADAVGAMRKIEQSSNQVSNIIGVIDEIAFQTNLLALNAGVEAARAGDAGKGFAVVAQEVRELAQRSARAAKEIKDLIRNSSIEVQVGVKLVRETGEALKSIEASIVTVNRHIGAIATSAREQSTALAEVNTAVNHMDQVTQKNAAMVEESNAASAALAAEATRLRELIDYFRLGGMSELQVEVLLQTAAVMDFARAGAPSPGKKVLHGGGAAKPQSRAKF